MMAKHIPMMLLALSTATGCLAFPGAEHDQGSVAAAIATAADIKEIPAVDASRYPDSVGYLYQGALANILWLQSEPRAGQYDDLVESMRRLVVRGVAGEILTSAMQPIETMPDTQPTLSQMSRAVVQSVRQLAQYTFVIGDYADSLGTALGAYNADPARQQAIADTAARVDAELAASATAGAAGTLPGGPPPANQGLLRPTKYFADAVREQAQARLARNAKLMQHAIDARNVTAYAEAFTEVFLAQRDIDLGRAAVEAIAVHHVGGLLRGQPLDAVIAKYVTALPTPDQPLSVEQLGLINRINLISGNPGTPRQPLVAALLLIDEDHRQGEQGPAPLCPLIWQHITDAAWLVSQLVGLKADGTTESQINALIANIAASI